MTTIFLHLGKFQPAEVGNFQSAQAGEFSTGTDNGNLITMQENLSTLPAAFKGTSGAGEVLVDAAGKYLYASNRGNDNILICSIDPANSQLTVVGWVHTQGRTPRHFNFDPTGSFIHVGNQD